MYSPKSSKKLVKFEEKKFRFWHKNFWLRYQYRYWYFRPILLTDTEFWSLTTYSLKPHSRWLPIHVVAEQGHLDLCKYIIGRNGHYNLTLKQIGSITTTFMSTPLHFASENGHFEICKLLIENMVHKNPATLDSDLWTPLHFAARFNHLDICRFVLLCPWFPHKKSYLVSVELMNFWIFFQSTKLRQPTE